MNQFNLKATHCFSEANQVADYLAKKASATEITENYFSFQQLSKGAKGPFLLVKDHISSIRSKYDKFNFFVS